MNVKVILTLHSIFFLIIFSLPYYFAAEENDNALVWLDDKENENNNRPMAENYDVDQSSSLANELFQPSTEWQEVKPGQTVPRGLHIRLNLETGKREAKLNDNDKQRFQYWSEGDRKGMVNSEHKVFTVKELKRALKEFEKESKSDQEENEHEDNIKSKFRPYKELKKDFEDMNMGVKTDLEILTDLVDEYRRIDCTIDRKLVILTDFEYLVHQIDIGRNFVDLGGLNIVKDCLNSTDPKFREAGAFIIGSSCQSNPKVQIAAMENGVLHQILRLFGSEKEAYVRKKLLFALSSLLRHFPFAQKKFLELGGIEVFEQVFRQNDEEKEKIKVVTLLFDLLHERKEIERLVSSRSEAVIEKLRQYRQVPLIEILVDRGFCTEIAKLFRRPTNNFDALEKILRTIDVIVEHCRPTFRTMKQEFLAVQNSLQKSLNDDGSNEFVESLIGLIDDILPKLNVYDEL